VPITSMARQSFERVFGLTIPEQLAWESWVEALTLENISLGNIKQRFPNIDQGYY
jgi:hypothetical protein